MGGNAGEKIQPNANQSQPQGPSRLTLWRHARGKGEHNDKGTAKGSGRQQNESYDQGPSPRGTGTAEGVARQHQDLVVG